MSVLESLLVGVFGMAVVFAVLIGLNLLLRLQSKLISLSTRKKPAAEAPAPEVPDGAPAEAEEEAGSEAPPPHADAETPHMGPKHAHGAYAAQAAGEAGVIAAPAPGRVLEVRTAVGSAVRHGQTLLVLEAMNIENEITADMDGTVTQILVSEGAPVGMGQPMLTIR